VQECQVAGALDRPGELSLVSGAGAGLAARADFAFFGDEAAQGFRLFVIDHLIMVGAKLADARQGIKSARAGRFLAFFLGFNIIHVLISFSDSI